MVTFQHKQRIREHKIWFELFSLQEDDGKKHTFNIVSRKLAISQRADNFITNYNSCNLKVGVWSLA